MVANNDPTTFKLRNGVGAEFVFAHLDGTIEAWNSAAQAEIVVDNSLSGAEYAGLAIEKNARGEFLLAANQRTGKIDTFDGNFGPAELAGTFSDPEIPVGFIPFSINVIENKVYVGYAKFDLALRRRIIGAGLGFVDIFDANGLFLTRAISSGRLNAPWAMAVAPLNSKRFSGDLLIGNFGDGVINAFNPIDFTFKGTYRTAKDDLFRDSNAWDAVFGLKTVGVCAFGCGAGGRGSGWGY